MGSPIRKSSDQSPVGGSPRHIAASNVLHRSCLPRHPPYALASNTHATCMRRKIPLANSQTTNHHTKNDHKTIETNNRVRFEINSKTKTQKTLVLLASTIQFSSHHAPPRRPDRHTAGPQARRASNRARQKPGVAIREPKSASAPPRHPPHDRRGKANDIFHTSNPSTRDHRAGGFAPDAERHPAFSVERR